MEEEKDLVEETKETTEDEKEIEETVEEVPTETTPEADLKKKKKKKIIIIVSIIVAILLIAAITIFLLTRNKKDNKQETKVVNQITITFDSNGGNKIEPLKVAKNGRINYPIPEREKYLFLGWYNVEEKVLRTTTFDSDVTLTAHWEELKETTKTMVINFETDNIIKIDSQTILCGTPIDIPEYIEPQTIGDYNYNIEKWTDENGKEVPNNSILPCKDITLTAVWNKYPIQEEKKCPTGFYISSERCVKTTAPITDCQNGTTESDHSCFDYNDKDEGERVCDSWAYVHKEDGSITNYTGLGEYFDGKCGYYILKDYTEDMCVKKYDEGPVWANGKCYATVVEDYTIKCPKGYGYFYADKMCYKEYLEYVSCPSGFELENKNGYKSCYQYTDPI